MSQIDRNPANLNLQSELGFKFWLERAPSVSYFTNTVKIPDISLPSADVGSPSLRVNMIGDHISYQPLSIKFKVDDDLQNWLEIFNWLNAIGNPDNNGIHLQRLINNQDFTGYGVYSNFFMLVNDSQQNPKFKFVFERAQPIALSGLTFQSTTGNPQYLESEAIFRYLKYTVEPL